jgi:serine/threonine protein kinase
MPELSKQTLRL